MTNISSMVILIAELYEFRINFYQLTADSTISTSQLTNDHAMPYALFYQLISYEWKYFGLE